MAFLVLAERRVLLRPRLRLLTLIVTEDFLAMQSIAQHDI